MLSLLAAPSLAPPLQRLNPSPLTPVRVDSRSAAVLMPPAAHLSRRQRSPLLMAARGPPPDSLQTRIESKFGKGFLRAVAIIIGILPYPLMLLGAVLQSTPQ
ncbi:hypothetical protein AB1Y20_018112 [Prymnesium parvum]|uniref:Uncharacterized protein n=1 Tax=Prymnesium parvum TaxID=97485 RepID=A0AB34JQL1_PRYPA